MSLLTATEVLKTKKKPGRKPTDTGRNRRSYSATQAKHLSGIKHILSKSNNHKFDHKDYFKTIRLSVDCVEDWIKNKIDALPIAKSAIISESDVRKRIEVWKYAHCIDWINIFGKQSANASNSNNNNSNNNNSNNSSSNIVNVSDIIEMDKVLNEYKALNNRIGLQQVIWKRKKENKFKKLDKDTKNAIEAKYYEEKQISKDDLKAANTKESVKMAKEQQKYKVKENVKKQHSILEFMNMK